MAPRSIARFKKLLPLALFAVLAVAGFSVWTQLPGWLGSPDPKRDVDVVVVPAGSADVRVPLAVRLLDRRAEQMWVVPSGNGPVLHEVDAIKKYAKSRGHA